MNGYIRSQRKAMGATATAIVALGLVAAPPARYHSAVPRAEFAAVQLQTAAAPLISALANSSSSAAVVATESAASASVGLVSTRRTANAAAATSPIDDLLVAIRKAIGAVLSPILLPIGALASTIDFACQGGNINCAVCAVAAIVVKVVASFGPYASANAVQSPAAARRSSTSAKAKQAESADPSATEAPATAQTARPTRSLTGRTTSISPRAAAVTQAIVSASSGNDARAASGNPAITPAVDAPARHKAPKSASSRIVADKVR